jgi:hypothetical protein
MHHYYRPELLGAMEVVAELVDDGRRKDGALEAGNAAR